MFIPLVGPISSVIIISLVVLKLHNWSKTGKIFFACVLYVVFAYVCICTYTQLIIIIHGFHICKFAYLLKFICDPQNWYSWRFCGHLWTYAVLQRIWVIWYPCSRLRSNKVILCFLISILILWTSVFFMVCLAPHFSHFFAFCWFKMTHKHSAEVLSVVSKCRKAFLLMEKISMLDKFHS